MKKAVETSHKTSHFTNVNELDRKWYLADANGEVLGRFASKLASIIRGKNNPKFTPNSDVGDFIVVINAEKIRVTGKREALKEYRHHSMYPGGNKVISFKKLLATHPETVIRNAVKGMLPKNRLGNRLINKLKVYSGSEHPHKAQNPKSLKF
jgi:large subunit ribosomal protein L13